MLASLVTRAAHLPLLIDEQQTVTAADTALTCGRMRDGWMHLQGTRVALRIRHPMAFMHALLALDGRASALLLIPAGMDEATVSEALDSARVDALIHDGNGQFSLNELATQPVRHFQPGSPAAGTEWLLMTSGTTDTPKIVPHQLERLAATAQRRQATGESLVWGLFYDPARFAGIQVVLQALVGGAALVLPAPDAPLPERMALLQRHAVNALSATPTLWRKLLMTRLLDGLSLRLVTLGGEIADQHVLTSLRTAFPQASVRHIYASTEAGVGFSVTDGKAGFPAAWLHTPPPGIELTVRRSPQSPSGELMVRSPRSARAYQSGVGLVDEQGWLGTGDEVLVSDQRVLFLGRINGAINVGGDKVFPESVEQVLCAHPAVAAARVTERANPMVGALVEAQVVLHAPQELTADLRQSILSHCKAALPRHACPALLKAVPTIETNASGKTARTAA